MRKIMWKHNNMKTGLISFKTKLDLAKTKLPGFYTSGLLSIFISQIQNYAGYKWDFFLHSLIHARLLFTVY